MSKTLRSVLLAAGFALTLAACTAPSSANSGAQKAQAGSVFVSPAGGGGGGGGGGGY